jgi:N-dimethylarginine dimethylaminohydrolase
MNDIAQGKSHRAPVAPTAAPLRARVPGGGTPRPTHWGIDSETGVLRDVLMGPIDHFAWQAGNAVVARSLRLGLKFDAAVARAQYAEVLDAFSQAGVRVHTLAPDEHLAYQIFARDSSVMTPWGAIIMQTQKHFRRGEYAACLRFYLGQGIPIYDMVTAGNVEGGDFMLLKPGLAACGYSGERSIEPAVQQIRSWFEAEGWTLQTYAFDPHFLHLDVQLGMVARDLAALCTEAVEPQFTAWLKSIGIRIIDVSYADAMQLGTNVVALGDDRALIPASSKNLVAACRAEGIQVFDPDVSMIAQGGGAIHCMCQALKRDPY